MDMERFYKIITSDEELKDIPLIYVMRVAIAVFEIIDSGECLYRLEEV